MSTLAEDLTLHLLSAASDLAVHWQGQARAVSFRPATSAPSVDEATGRDVIRALAGALSDAEWQSEPIRVGWEYGARWFRADRSLHQMLKEVDLLLAIVLYDVEQYLIGNTVADAADGVSVARRLQRAVSVFMLAASKGFTQAHTEHLRDHYRVTRHDLRNSLGTIRSAMAFMDDEAVPEEVRSNPRMRTMVTRNAATLDDLIREQLSDGAAMTSAFVRQTVELSDLVWAVTRAVRDELQEAGCSIEVADSMPAITTDAAGWELVLRALLLGVARNAPGTRIQVACERDAGDAIVLALRCAQGVDTPFSCPPGGVPEFARELARRCGGRIWDDGALRVSIPSSTTHARNDLTRASQR